MISPFAAACRFNFVSFFLLLISFSCSLSSFCQLLVFFSSFSCSLLFQSQFLSPAWSRRVFLSDEIVPLDGSLDVKKNICRVSGGILVYLYSQSVYWYQPTRANAFSGKISGMVSLRLFSVYIDSMIDIHYAINHLEKKCPKFHEFLVSQFSNN